MSATGYAFECQEQGAKFERERLRPVIDDLREALESSIAAMRSLAGPPGLGVHRLRQIEKWQALIDRASPKASDE